MKKLLFLIASAAVQAADPEKNYSSSNISNTSMDVESNFSSGSTNSTKDFSSGLSTGATLGICLGAAVVCGLFYCAVRNKENSGFGSDRCWDDEPGTFQHDNCREFNPPN